MLGSDVGGRGNPLANAYAAPEALRDDDAKAKQAGDVFSFGVLLFEMVVGKVGGLT